MSTNTLIAWFMGLSMFAVACGNDPAAESQRTPAQSQDVVESATKVFVSIMAGEATVATLESRESTAFTLVDEDATVTSLSFDSGASTWPASFASGSTQAFTLGDTSGLLAACSSGLAASGSLTIDTGPHAGTAVGIDPVTSLTTCTSDPVANMVYISVDVRGLYTDSSGLVTTVAPVTVTPPVSPPPSTTLGVGVVTSARVTVNTSTGVATISLVPGGSMAMLGCSATGAAVCPTDLYVTLPPLPNDEPGAPVTQLTSVSVTDLGVVHALGLSLSVYSGAMFLGTMSVTN